MAGVEIAISKLKSEQPTHNHGLVRLVLDTNATVVEQYCVHTYLMHLDPNVSVWKVELPLKWPLIGMLPSLVWNFKYLHDWVTHLLNISGGTFILQLPWMNRVLTADAGNLEYMLKTRFHNFVKSNYLKSVLRDLFGDIVFSWWTASILSTSAA